MTLETERLLLKPFSAEDAALVLELYNTPKFLKFVGDRIIRNEDDAIQYIQNIMEPQMQKLGFGNYVMILKETGEKMGGVGVFKREGFEVMDIGFSLLPRFIGLGYAFEGSEFLIRNIHTNFGLQKVSAMTVESNAASIKLIEKLGLKYIKKVAFPNDPEELLYYEKTI